MGRFGSCSPRARGGPPSTRRDGFVLTDDAPAELVLHMQQLLALAFEHLVDRNAGPARDDLRDMSSVTASSTSAPVAARFSVSASFFSSSG